MPRPWRIVRLLVRSIAGFLVCMSVAHAASKSIIWESGDQIVRLAKQDDASAPPNDHPTTTTAGDVAAMLEGLRLRYADEEIDVTPVSVFTKEEIDNLSKAVAKGLDRATSSQDVIFHVIGARQLSRGTFARRNRVSAGRVFYRDGNYNIIFGQIQTPHRKKNVYGQVDQDFYPRNYGSRTTAAKHDVVLLTSSATRLNDGNDGVRGDWIVIDSNATVTGGQRNADPDPDPTDARAPTQLPAPVALAEAPPISKATATESNESVLTQPQDLSAPATGSTTNVEQRLEALKRLRERELISEEVYQSKMKEILQDL